MRQYELTERVLNYNPKADEALLNRAYVYAMKAHSNQKRASGDPYFSHPLEVAAILTGLRLDDATIATALLHDVIEDTPATRADIDKLFGPEIGTLVEGLTKIKKLDLVSKKAEQAENFRDLLVAISSDIRVLLVKLADRLHNMRTLEHNGPESRRRNSEETLEIYAPLAGRMGMQEMREELEDLSFKWLHPDAYQMVTAKLADIRTRNVGLVAEIQAALEAKLKEAGITAEVAGREKRALLDLAQDGEPADLRSNSYPTSTASGSIVDERAGLLSRARRRACDVARGPRPLQGLHLEPEAEQLSVDPHDHRRPAHATRRAADPHRGDAQRRRTRHCRACALQGAHRRRPDAAAGHGAADGPLQPTGSLPHKDNPYRWLRHLVGTLLDGNNPEEFLEHTKLELFHDQVFCFTPKGSIIALPRGATPIDFAYAVHTDVGNNCVGALINGRQHPLSTQLRNGDEVVVLTAKDQIPPAAWDRSP